MVRGVTCSAVRGLAIYAEGKSHQEDATRCSPAAAGNVNSKAINRMESEKFSKWLQNVFDVHTF